MVGLISLIIAIIICGVIFELIGYFINGVGVGSAYLTYLTFKRRYNMDRFKPKMNTLLAWRKNHFDELEIEFTIVNNETREIFNFELAVNSLGRVMKIDDYKYDHDEFFEFLDKHDRSN